MQILGYHVHAKDAYEASDLEKLDSLVMVQGEALKVQHLYWLETQLYLP